MNFSSCFVLYVLGIGIFGLEINDIVFLVLISSPATALGLLFRTETGLLETSCFLMATVEAVFS